MHTIGISTLALAALATAGACTEPAVLTSGDSHLLLNGQPIQIISAEMHYPRIPRPYWRDRMKKARAMGCNALTTYVFWNLHEPKPGKFDFKGNNDVAAFIKTAQEERLHVILRPGPYVCSEWDFGGYPAWLLADDTLTVRARDLKFMKACERYLNRLAKEVKPLLGVNGGPILMVQVENEYGSYGADREYMRNVRDLFKAAGFDALLFTADGPDQMPNGMVDDLFAAFNFGGGAEQAYNTARKHRPKGPMMVGEYWCGWFDHWGVQHHTVNVKDKADDIDWLLSHDCSVSIYMAHGGTNFGWMAGANDPPYRADTTSYDYDAPISEDGRLKPMWYAFRDVIRKHLPEGTVLPEPPEPLPVIGIPKITLDKGVSLWDILPKPVEAKYPIGMETLGQSYGMVLYRADLKPNYPKGIPFLPEPVEGAPIIRNRAPMTIPGFHGYATVFIDRKKAGTLDRRLGQSSLILPDRTKPATLDILVENTGRVNFGRALPGEQQGLFQKVDTDVGAPDKWRMYCLPFDNVAKLPFGKIPAGGPAVLTGTFRLDRAGDTFLDMRGWGKGNVWVNGHHLGRYWRIGPQQTLYLPGCWLKKGENRIIVFDVDYAGQTTLSGLPAPILDELRVHG